MRAAGFAAAAILRCLGLVAPSAGSAANWLEPVPVGTRWWFNGTVVAHAPPGICFDADDARLSAAPTA